MNLIRAVCYASPAPHHRHQCTYVWPSAGMASPHPCLPTYFATTKEGAVLRKQPRFGILFFCILACFFEVLLCCFGALVSWDKSLVLLQTKTQQKKKTALKKFHFKAICYLSTFRFKIMWLHHDSTVVSYAVLQTFTSAMLLSSSFWFYGERNNAPLLLCFQSSGSCL